MPKALLLIGGNKKGKNEKDFYEKLIRRRVACPPALLRHPYNKPLGHAIPHAINFLAERTIPRGFAAGFVHSNGRDAHRALSAVRGIAWLSLRTL